jgi:hypothetical protein
MIYTLQASTKYQATAPPIGGLLGANEGYFNNVTEQGNLCMTAMADHPFSAKLEIITSHECFAQFK